MAITPNVEQFAQLAADAGASPGEVVMLNLLRFKRSGDGGSAAKGEEAYQRYGREAVAMVEAQGGRVLWMGKPDQVLIGDITEDAWDAVALVSYPSRKAFIDMVSSDGYQSAHEHREEGLDHTVLLAMSPAPDFES